MRFTQNLDDFITDKTIYGYGDFSEQDYSNFDNKHIFCGSFNPLHYGHLAVANHYEKANNVELLFETCLTRFDKKEMMYSEILEVKSQFDQLGRTIIFTRCNSFLSKLTNFFLWDHFKFIVGMDTILRIGSSEYYFGSKEESERVFSLLKQKKTEFIVYPRQSYDSKMLENVSPVLLELCTFVLDFEPVPISSTVIRYAQSLNKETNSAK